MLFQLELWKEMKKRNILILVAAYFTYLLCGAGIFVAMERPREIEKCKEAQTFKKELIKMINNSKTNSWTLDSIDQIIKVDNYM